MSCFYDSSIDASCESVYVRVACQHGDKVTLWASKSWLPPSKLYSIPRLELMSSLLLSKSIVTVKESVECEEDLSSMFFWFESEVALWIRQQSKNGMFGYKSKKVIKRLFHLQICSR